MNDKRQINFGHLIGAFYRSHYFPRYLKMQADFGKHLEKKDMAMNTIIVLAIVAIGYNEKIKIVTSEYRHPQQKYAEVSSSLFFFA